MSRSYAILGAGLMGRMMAYALAQGGARVEMFERSGPDAEQSAARVAASMLAPLAESAITEASVVRMGLYGLDRWKSLIEQLNKKVEQQTFFQQDGTLVLWHRLDAAEAQRFAEHLERNVRMNPALSSPWHLDSKALAELEPSVAERFSQGLFLPREGQLDNRQLLTALLEALQQLDVKLHWHTACEPDDLADHGFDWVIDCRGLGAKSSWSNTHNPLRGVRGEVIRVHAPEVKLQRPTRLIHPRYPIYKRTLFNGTLISCVFGSLWLCRSPYSGICNAMSPYAQEQFARDLCTTCRHNANQRLVSPWLFNCSCGDGRRTRTSSRNR